MNVLVETNREVGSSAVIFQEVQGVVQEERRQKAEAIERTFGCARVGEQAAMRYRL